MFCSNPSIRGSIPDCSSIAILAAILLGASLENTNAATNLWNAALDFTEFQGNAGGFEDDSAATLALRTVGNRAPTTTQFDVLQPAGNDPATGLPLYSSGQDGVADLSITTRLIDGSQGRWGNFQAEKRLGDYRSGINLASGASHSGDHGIVAYEFSVSVALNVTAGDLSLRLVSANGSGQLYEWAFVTVGTVNDAPFSLASFADYNATIYSNLQNATYLDANGAPTGPAGTGAVLEHGKSISQFLAGSEASPVSGGVVAPGWYAIDDFNSIVADGPETTDVNPLGGDGSLPGTQSITGSSLGLGANQPLTTFTVWLGFYDVGFDTTGDGFTTTRGRQSGSISSLALGTSVEPLPEPSTSFLGFLCCVAAIAKRRR